MAGEEYGAFGHGDVRYPLDATNPDDEPFLKRADPALWTLLQFLPAVLDYELGAAWAAYAALEKFPSQEIINTTASVEPVPALYSDRVRFPFFTIYRKSSVTQQHTVCWNKSISELEFAYVLPPFVPKVQEKLNPILWSITRVIARYLWTGHHPAYEANAPVLLNAGVMNSRLVNSRFEKYAPLTTEPKANVEQFYRAVVGTLEIIERDMPVADAFEPMTGADVNIGNQVGDGNVYEDVATVGVELAPTLTSVSPTSGSKAGGTGLAIIGTNFTSPMRLWVGGIEVPATVVSPTALTATTPPHDAFPTFMADVEVEDLHGQRARLTAGFTFTTP